MAGSVIDMRVLHVASEVFPLAKTGGLADVSAALPAALNELDIDARLILPGYPQAIERAAHPREIARFDGLLGCGDVRLLSTRLPDTGLHTWLVDCPALYGRGGGIYQNEGGHDWHDNALRFAMLNHVAALVADGSADTRWRPDVVHAHDWHAGLVPLLLSARREPRPATVLTIHNLAYQGVFAAEELGRLALPSGSAVYSALEFHGRLSFLKAGISWADALTTVSPTYSREILTPEYGCGLDGLLRERATRLAGIMNGADYRVWDPGNDVHLPATYTVRQISGKRACKAAIQNEMGLTPDLEAPLMAFMSRLAHQKMPDVVLEALPALLGEGVQFALVADGDAGYANRFHELAARYHGQVSVRTGYEEPVAHRLLAGTDLLLHPSRYEPCGLSPIYAMRYGTLPIVRRSGGLADSVVDADQSNIKEGIATGFSFSQPTADDLIARVQRALSLYRQPIAWRKIQSCAMRQEFSWSRSAHAYADLYRTMAAGSAEIEIEREVERVKITA
jgi:starch synthase